MVLPTTVIILLTRYFNYNKCVWKSIRTALNGEILHFPNEEVLSVGPDFNVIKTEIKTHTTFSIRLLS